MGGKALKVQPNPMYSPVKTVELAWVPLAKYCELTGETPNTVRKRRQQRVWSEGKQSRKAPNGNLWINLIEVQKWVESGTE